MVIGSHGRLVSGFGLPVGNLSILITPPLDYLLFAVICLAAVGTASLLLRRSGKAHQTLRLAWILIPLILITGYFLVRKSGERERGRLRTQIEGFAPTYADELASMGHASLAPGIAEDDPLYLRMIEKQIRWLELNPTVADIYTFRKHPEGNQLIVDSETDYDDNGIFEGEREARTEIGEVWDEKNERLETAFAGTPSFDDIPYSDRWGVWVSAYEPMRDDAGRVEAVLGVDFHAKDWLKAIRRARMATIGFLAVLVTTVLAAVSMITVLRANLVERRRSEAALRKAKEAAEQATNAKSEFLANMSHEIRTPMNGILGLTELLLDTEMSPQQRGYQKLVKHSAESLLSVLNDILDFSKVEAGKLELDCHEFELRDSVADTLHGLGLNIAGRPIELACRIGQDVPNQLIGDLGRFRQILINLVGNALKFTQEGEVLLEISLGEIKGEEISLVVTVSDSGIGIPAEKKQSIFESFTQADSATTRNFGGTGLGLTISAQLVKLMHGRIWVESEPGVGSKFHFTARFTLPRGLTDSPDPLPTHLSDLQVIVADDHATSRQILAEMLAQWGISPAIASSGREALELLDAADTKTASSNRLLILDRSMPEIDGEAVARQIKSRQIPNPPKILLLSPAGRLMDEAEMAELGISRVLAKPLKASSLRRAIEHCLDRGTSSGEEHENARSLPSLAERQTVAPRAHGLKLLLAEDGRVNQVVATQILKEGGHQVTLATNGREVLDALKRDRFDAIIMDVQMPEIDGYQATEQIRANERESGTHIPIIAMTANAMAEDREKCLASGMDAYVAKPVQRDELFSALEQAIVN